MCCFLATLPSHVVKSVCKFECGTYKIDYNIISGWVAVQYHWILDESALCLGESEGRAKYKQEESNGQ